MRQETTRSQCEQVPRPAIASRRRQLIPDSIAMLLVAFIAVVCFTGCGSAPDEQQISSSATEASDTGANDTDGSATEAAEADVELTDDADSPSGSDHETQAEPSDDEDAEVELDRLLGRWQRTDAEYVIEIVSIAKNGETQAAYYNPRPIRVAKAKAEQDGDTLRLFVELRDTGYPGCLYELEYYPQHDGLVGIYFQAAQQQKYQVVFVRAE